MLLEGGYGFVMIIPSFLAGICATLIEDEKYYRDSGRRQRLS